MRLGVRVDGRRCNDRARRHGRPRQRRSIFALPCGGRGGAGAAGIRIGAPPAGQRIFFGDREATRAYDEALTRFAKLGATVVEIDVELLYETARLLDQGPWLAERYLAVRSMPASLLEAIHPVTRAIILEGVRPTAADAFVAFYRLEELRQARDGIFTRIDALALPTMPTVYTVDQVLAYLLQLNSRLGTYTNFVNLLDLCGLAVPAAMCVDGAPSGITLLAPAGRYAALATIGRAFHADTGLPLGATGRAQPPLVEPPSALRDVEIPLAVVGAHLSGHGAQRRAAAAQRALRRGDNNNRRLSAQTRLPASRRRSRACCGSRTARAPRSRSKSGRSVAEFGRSVGDIPPPMSIGTCAACRRRQRQGFPGRGEGDRRRARHLELRRLARFCWKQGLGA